MMTNSLVGGTEWFTHLPGGANSKRRWPPGKETKNSCSCRRRSM